MHSKLRGCVCMCVLTACVSRFRLGAEELPPDWLAQCQNEKSRPAFVSVLVCAPAAVPPCFLVLLTPRSSLCRPPTPRFQGDSGDCSLACLIRSLQAISPFFVTVLTFVHLFSPVAHDTWTRNLYISRLSRYAVTSQASV